LQIVLKKGLSIFLLFVFLFNTVGYKALYYFKINSANERIKQQIQATDYAADKLITVKIPLNLPYVADWADYQMAEGEIIYKQKTYKYIKKKIKRDTLFLICLDHSEKNKLDKESEEYNIKVNDLNAKKAFGKPVKYDFDKKEFYQPSNPYILIHASCIAFKLASSIDVFLKAHPNPPDHYSYLS